MKFKIIYQSSVLLKSSSNTATWSYVYPSTPLQAITAMKVWYEPGINNIDPRTINSYDSFIPSSKNLLKPIVKNIEPTMKNKIAYKMFN